MICWITNKALNNRVVNIQALTTITGVITRTIENRSVWRLMALTAAWKIGSYNHVLLRLCLHCTLVLWDTLIEIWWVYEFVRLQHKFTLKSGYTVLIEPTSKLSFSHAACMRLLSRYPLWSHCLHATYWCKVTTLSYFLHEIRKTHLSLIFPSKITSLL